MRALADVMEVLEEEGCLLADGLEAALIGYVSQFNRVTALYDFDRCVDVLVADGMTEDDAIEYLEFNTLGAWVGEKTPSFAFLVKEESMHSARTAR